MLAIIFIMGHGHNTSFKVETVVSKEVNVLVKVVLAIVTAQAWSTGILVEHVDCGCDTWRTVVSSLNRQLPVPFFTWCLISRRCLAGGLLLKPCLQMVLVQVCLFILLLYFSKFLLPWASSGYSINMSSCRVVIEAFPDSYCREEKLQMVLTQFVIQQVLHQLM